MYNKNLAIYDDESFFNNYIDLRNAENNYNDLIEQPIVFELLGNIKGKRVMDIGCGYGAMTIKIARNGADKVLGIDVSEKMIEKGIRENAHANITYKVLSAEELCFIDEKFDVIVSCLAIHYIENFEKLFADVQAAEVAVEKFLGQQEFSADQQTEIMQIITRMSFANTLDGSRPQLSLAGQIVQDADWLDALGAIGIARAVYYGGKHREKLYDPQLSPRAYLDRAEYRNLANETIINHFSEKLFKLAGLLNTKTAQAIAVERETFMHQFVRRFLAEWEGEA